MARKPTKLPSEPEHYFESLPGQTDVETWLSENSAPREAIGGNGGPALDESAYATLARIGRSVYGPLWEGKLAGFLGADPRTLRRWREGQGEPSPRVLAKARAWALRTAAALLAAAGEDVLAEAVARRRDAIHAKARKRGAELLRQTLDQKGAGG